MPAVTDMRGHGIEDMLASGGNRRQDLSDRLWTWSQVIGIAGDRQSRMSATTPFEGRQGSCGKTVAWCGVGVFSL